MQLADVPNFEMAGRLHTGKQPGEDVVHGGVREQIPAARPPPRLVAAVGARPPGPHRLQRGVPVPVFGVAEPERPRRRRPRRPGQPGPLRGRQEQLPAIGAGDLYQCTDGGSSGLLRGDADVVGLAVAWRWIVCSMVEWDLAVSSSPDHATKLAILSST